MQLERSTILIYGGSGLVGHAIARRLLRLRPERLVLVALGESEVQRAAAELEREADGTTILTAWGDVFLPTEIAQYDHATIAADPRMRLLLIRDLLGEFGEDVLHRSLFYQLLDRHRPHAVVDCINTATAFAYQDVYQRTRDLLARARDQGADGEMVEQYVLMLPIPQLIRHVQIAAEALQRTGVRAYVKVGTSGTGGMGLNIPYTHSEERPSRVLLTKSALAGAHSLLLFLIARTPGAPAVTEIKPTAAIGWREICYGPIRRRGVVMTRVDCPRPLPLHGAFGPEARGWKDSGEPITSVYADMGENGYFARQEFETVTSLGSMELITPEEIAEYVVLELQGRPTGRDVVAALDGATAGPTYRAGVVRAAAVERLRELERTHGVESVAFELLGPPRLTKLLYEAHVWSRLVASVDALAASDPAELARGAAHLLAADHALRSLILSVGLPIVVEENLVYRGTTVLVPPEADPERAIARGWVDLRVGNCHTWRARARRVVEQAALVGPASGSGSGEDWGAMRPSDAVSPSRFAAWVFKQEDGGERIKR